MFEPLPPLKKDYRQAAAIPPLPGIGNIYELKNDGPYPSIFNVKPTQLAVYSSHCD